MSDTLILNASLQTINRFYVYGLVDPRSNQLFYVGKGSYRRAWSHTSLVKKGKSTNNRVKDSIIGKILKDGFEPEIKMFAKHLNETDALELEHQLILSYGNVYDKSGCLVNVCEGGKQVPLNSGRTRWKTGRTPWNKGKTGFTCSEETKAKMSSSRLGQKYALGAKHSEEANRRRVESRSWYKPSDDTKRKMSDSQKGRIFTEDHKSKLREAARARILRERMQNG